MRLSRSTVFWFFCLFGVPIILYIVLSMVFGDASFLCFFSVLVGASLPFIVYKIKDSSLYHNPDKKEFSDYREEEQKQDYSVGKTKSKKRGGISSLFSGEEICDTCGTEMEYREEYDGYYCPECHEYK